MRKNVQITAVLGGLLILALFLWWQSGGWLTPELSTEPAEVQDPGAKNLQGEGGGQKSQDAEREQIAAEGAAGNKHTDATTGSLRIRLLYGDDRSPAAGVAAYVREIRRTGPRPPRHSARTGAEGEAVVAGLRPGSAWVSTRPGMGTKRVQVIAGKETEVVLTLKVGVDVTGQVVDKDAVGVANAMVVLGDWTGSRSEVLATTDDAGRFALKQIPTHSHVGARAKGYAPSPLWSVVSGAGSKVKVRIILPGVGGSVQGQVLDSDGKGIANATVKIGTPPRPGYPITLPDGAQGMETPCWEASTDDEGRFLAEGLRTGPQPVEVTTGAFAPWTGSVDVVAHMTTPLAIRLTRGVAVEGTIRNENGKPVGGVDVNHGRYRTVEHRRTRSAEDGSYRLEGLPPDKAIKVTVRSDKSGGASKELKGRSGETLRWDVTLSRGLVLRGTVFGREGKPLQKALVRAISGRWSRHEYTDEKGRFELIQCPKGPVRRLEVERKGYEPLARVNVDPASPLSLHMVWEGEPTSRIVGQLVDPDGKPVPDAVIYIRRRGGGSGGNTATPTSKGEIKIEKKRPGFYMLRIRAANFAVHLTKERRIGPGETWDLGRIALVRGGRLRLDLKLPKDRTKERLYLSIYMPDGRWDSGFATRERPLLSEPMEPGRYHLKVTGPRIFPQTIPFEIREGQETAKAVVPRFATACVLQFVLPAGNEKVRRIEYSVTGAGGFTIDSVRGRLLPVPFKQELGLIPGRYTVQAKSETGHRGQAEFEVKAPSASPQTVRVVMK